MTSNYQKMLSNLFIILSGLFVAFLMVTVYYEVLIVQELPTDNKTKLDNITQKYGPDFKIGEQEEIVFNNPFIPNAAGKILNCKDRTEKDTEPCYKFVELDYNFVHCYDEDSKINITYPEGTECFEDAEDQDDYNYEKNESGKTIIKEEERDEDDDDEDDSNKEDKENKYSIQICPPRCGHDDEDEDDDEDRESAREVTRDEEKAMKEAEDDDED